jgi:hypothetical protein
MQYNEGKGSLFKNSDKTEDQHADYRGEANIGGEPHWVNAWVRTAKSGIKYLSLSIKRKEPPKDAPQRTYANRRDDIDMLS